MKKFRVCVVWTMSATIEVEADSLNDAIRIAEETEGLPEKSIYVDDSFMVDLDATQEANED